MTYEPNLSAREAMILDNLPYARWLAQVTVKRMPPWVSLDDAVQEASIGLIQGVARWDPSRLVYGESRQGVMLREFLKRRIVGRVLHLDRRRKAGLTWGPQPRKPVEVADSSPSPEQLVSRQETQQAVAAAVASLPPRLRQMVRWRYWDGLTHVEIGRLDGGVTEQRVTGMHTAALKRLRRSPELARIRRR